MKSINDCKSINSLNQVLESQGISVPDTAFIYCSTIKEMIAIAKTCGAK